MKKIFFFWLLLACITIISCSKKMVNDTPLPADLISEDKMVELLAEQYIWEATMDFVNLGIGQYLEEGFLDSLDSVRQNNPYAYNIDSTYAQQDTLLYCQVCQMVSTIYIPVDSINKSPEGLYNLPYKFYGNWFKKNNITEKQYHASLKYYLRNPDAAQVFVEKVRKRISKICEKNGLHIDRTQEQGIPVQRKGPSNPN